VTLPKASKFPALPAGYRFELEHDGISYTHRENQYVLRVMPADPAEDEDWPLVSTGSVIESYVLESAQRLAEIAQLELASQGGDTKVQVGQLNHELRKQAK
jgi:hypothetical protein